MRCSSYCLFILLVTSFSFSSLLAQDPFSVKPKTDSLPVVNARVSDQAFDAYLRSQIKFSVPVITVEQLKQMQDEQYWPLFILDARSQAEYEVSHIKGARRVGYEDFGVEKVWNLDRDAPIIVYCGIGERSEKIAEKLKQMGFTKVFNLYGSIIEWVNQGYAVVDKNGRITKKVHVHDRSRLRWLKQGKAIF